MESTHLDLLTSEGTLSVTFTPALDPDHYGELNQIVQQADDDGELKSAVIQAAHRWGRTIDID